MADTTVFVLTVGDEVNYADCLAHLRSQSVAFPLSIIDHVFPLSAALQEMQNRCGTEYYVQVDEDMQLFPHAVETLRTAMTTAPDNTAMICAPLWDCDAELMIQGVKIYRRSIQKMFPYRNVMSSEIEQLGRVKAAGYKTIIHPADDAKRCLGEHGKHYSRSTIFARWQRCFHKQKRYGRMRWVEPYPRILLDRYVTTRDPLHLYAFLGAIAGIVGPPPPDQEVDWRKPNELYETLERYLSGEIRAGGSNRRVAAKEHSPAKAAKS